MKDYDKERFIKGKGLMTIGEDGKKTIHMRIVRPITDPEWNRRQMNTRIRKSKKQRLAERRKIQNGMKKV